MQASGYAGDKVLYKATVAAPTVTSVQEQIERMTASARAYVRKTPLSQQFPACVDSHPGLLGATTSNWAEQEMELMKKNPVRGAPDILSALMAVVEYASETYLRNYVNAHSENDVVPQKFKDSYARAFKKALVQSMPKAESIDKKIARIRSATKPHFEYVSKLIEGGSECSCGAFKVKGEFCWHYAQHCRAFGFDPWTCKFANLFERSSATQILVGEGHLTVVCTTVADDRIKVETMKKCYRIQPFGGPATNDLATAIGDNPVISTKTRTGRPAKVRRLKPKRELVAAGEKAPRRNQCSHCNAEGHTKSTCPSKSLVPRFVCAAC